MKYNDITDAINAVIYLMDVANVKNQLQKSLKKKWKYQKQQEVKFQKKKM